MYSVYVRGKLVVTKAEESVTIACVLTLMAAGAPGYVLDNDGNYVAMIDATGPKFAPRSWDL